MEEENSDEEPEPEVELTASEKLRQLKEEQGITVKTEEIENSDDETDEENGDDEGKRKATQKGGSFGPTVGGFNEDRISWKTQRR